jgi:hypothetical protein
MLYFVISLLISQAEGPEMVLTADSSARPFGEVLEWHDGPRYRGIQWANQDFAGLLVPVRIRVPRAHRMYMGHWWIGDGHWEEFLGLIVGVKEEHGVLNWVAPWTVLESEGLDKDAHGAVVVERGLCCFSDAYSDDVPMEWIVGTANLALRAGGAAGLDLGECTCICREGLPDALIGLIGQSNRCSQVSAEISGQFYRSGVLCKLRAKVPRLDPRPRDFLMADRQLLSAVSTVCIWSLISLF